MSHNRNRRAPWGTAAIAACSLLTISGHQAPSTRARSDVTAWLPPRRTSPLHPAIWGFGNSRRHETHSARLRALPKPAVWEGELTGDKCQTFLQEFWQKKPLLIRKAFVPGAMVLTPGEVLSLACDELVTSRIVEQHVKGGDWDVRYGPFDDQDFVDDDSGRRWTVLVNDVDRHVPEVADLLESFQFVPNWRVDDIQVSYAPKAGGIGPHIDNYDVFLLQGRGRRRWSIENRFVSPEEEVDRLVEGSPVRVFYELNEDEAHAWDLEPGDMLYLPPRIPHNGVSLDGDCMTYSVGFRAPTQKDLLLAAADYTQQYLLGDNVFYTDPDLVLQSECGEIQKPARDRMRALVQEAVSRALSDDRIVAKWVGEFVTSPKRERLDEDYPRPLWAGQLEEGEEGIDDDDAESWLPCEWRSAADVLDAIRRGTAITLYRAEGIKFAFIADQQLGPLLFVDGRRWQVPPDAAFLAPLITRGPRIAANDLRPHLSEGGSRQAAAEELLGDLMDQGFLYPVRDEIS